MVVLTSASCLPCRRSSPLHSSLLRGVAVRARRSAGAAPSQAQRTTHVLAAAELSGVTTLPIFPLGLVVGPGGDLPLQIYEARYRVLFSTLLAGAESVDSELVDSASPFAGSRLFGLSFGSPQGLAVTGTALRIEEHECLADGRMLVSSKGVQRYRIVEVLKELPVLICKVEWFSDLPEEGGGDEEELSLPLLADKLRTLFVNTLTLSNRSKGDTRETDLPEELSALSPSELSFWLMRVFVEHPTEQQRMLDMQSVRERLMCAEVVLQETFSYLAATTALKSAMRDISEQKPGGEDSA